MPPAAGTQGIAQRTLPPATTANRKRATVGYYQYFKTVNSFLNLRNTKRLER
jgi:hypothetical protein